MPDVEASALDMGPTGLAMLDMVLGWWGGGVQQNMGKKHDASVIIGKLLSAPYKLQELLKG